MRALESGGAPWLQVAVAEWSGLLGEFIDPENVMVFAPGDPEPPGVAEVVFASTVMEEDPTRTRD